DTQREKTPVAVERQFADQVSRPSVMIARDRLRARSEPLYWPTHALGGKHDGNELGINFVPDAEAAAHVGGVDAKFFRREAHDAGQRTFYVGGALRGNAKLKHLTRRVVGRNAGLRLHGIAGNPLRVKLDPDDMRGLRESRLGACSVAVLVVERQIFRPFLLHARAPPAHSL